MNDKENSHNYIGYEYKEVAVDQSMASFYIDGYTNFGWIVEEETNIIGSRFGMVSLQLKRDRKIRNKAELTRLQRKFETDMEEIKSLENSKTTKASVVAYIIGIIGAAFMAGSVFAVTSDNIVLCVILAIPAFVGWIVPYFAFKQIVRSKTKEITPIVERKYDEVYEVCEKASKLAN